MKFSLRWLSQYLDVKVPVPQMLDGLTLAGTEVERVTTTGVDSPYLIVGQIISSAQHPNADRLRVCQVNDGQGVRQIVCGAKNFQDGDKVPLALPGAKLPGGISIKESKLRGELSQGMLCSARELELAGDADGLLLLPADAPVGMKFSEYLPGDTIFEVEITSNRPDLLSYLGMAREIAATGAGVLKTVPRADFTMPENAPLWTAELGADDLCPFYSATHLTGVKVGSSPAWLQKAIEATGHRPINNVVDITNFVLFETGQPLHAFDAGKLAGNIITARRARAGEKLEALDDKTYTLLADDLVIADATGPAAIAGVMGGKPTAVTAETTEILLEAAWFLPTTVRRTSHRLGLSSDSSYRYERRVDPGALLAARDRAIGLLLELTGAKLSSTSSDLGTLPATNTPITLRPTAIEKLLGVAVPETEVTDKLTRLGCVRLETGAEKGTIWQAPRFRHDLAREVDLIEEVARLRGLEGIPARLTTRVHPETAADRTHDELLRLRQTLAARGWDECVTDALVERRFVGEGAVELANPFSELQTHLRPDLQTSMLQVAARNLARGVAGLKLFELGRAYRQRQGTTEEPMRLGLLVAGQAEAAAWYQTERASDFFDLKGVIELLRTSGAMDEKNIVTMGPVAATDLKLHGIKTPVYYAEISLGEFSRQDERFQPLPAFPLVRRDVAVVVAKTVPQEKVEETIRAAKAPNLEAVQLFDVFADVKGEKIAADRKSLAYALTYRSRERTLTEKEVNEAHEMVRRKLVMELGCTFRE